MREPSQCRDCSGLGLSGGIQDGLCDFCRSHQADGHEPRMTWTYSENGRFRSPDGYCHGYGEHGRDFVTGVQWNASYPTPPDEIPTERELNAWRARWNRWMLPGRVE